MIYIDEDGKTQCTECCISCKEKQNICEARKERRRWTRRDIYKAKKEYRQKQGAKS